MRFNDNKNIIEEKIATPKGKYSPHKQNNLFPLDENPFKEIEESTKIPFPNFISASPEQIFNSEIKQKK